MSDNTLQPFISEEKGSYLVAVSDDRHPQIEVIFGGKHEYRTAEHIDAEEFIGKKGYQAKGKKASQYEIKEIRFIEPLHKPEDDMEEDDADSMNPEPDTDDKAAAPADTPADMAYDGKEDEADEQLSLF